MRRSDWESCQPCKSDPCGGEKRKVGNVGLQCSSLKVLVKEMENPQAKVVRRVLSPRKSLILVSLLNHWLGQVWRWHRDGDWFRAAAAVVSY